MLQFVEKHRKIEEQKRMMGLAAENKKQIFESQLNEGVIKARMKSENEMMRKAQNVLKKHEFLDKRVKDNLIQAVKKKEEIEKYKLYKNEIRTLKNEEFNYNLKKQEKFNDYFREKSSEKIQINSDRVDEYK